MILGILVLCQSMNSDCGVHYKAFPTIEECRMEAEAIKQTFPEHVIAYTFCEDIAPAFEDINQ